MHLITTTWMTIGFFAIVNWHPAHAGSVLERNVDLEAATFLARRSELASSQQQQCLAKFQHTAEIKEKLQALLPLFKKLSLGSTNGNPGPTRRAVERRSIKARQTLPVQDIVARNLGSMPLPADRHSSLLRRAGPSSQYQQCQLQTHKLPALEDHIHKITAKLQSIMTKAQAVSKPLQRRANEDHDLVQQMTVAISDLEFEISRSRQAMDVISGLHQAIQARCADIGTNQDEFLGPCDELMAWQRTRARVMAERAAVMVAPTPALQVAIDRVRASLEHMANIGLHQNPTLSLPPPPPPASDPVGPSRSLHRRVAPGAEHEVNDALTEIKLRTMYQDIFRTYLAVVRFVERHPNPARECAMAGSDVDMEHPLLELQRLHGMAAYLREATMVVPELESKRKPLSKLFDQIVADVKKYGLVPIPRAGPLHQYHVGH